MRHFWDLCAKSVSFLSNLVFAFTEGFFVVDKTKCYPESSCQSLPDKKWLKCQGCLALLPSLLFSHTTHSYSSELQRDFLGIKKDFCKYISRSSNQVSGKEINLCIYCNWLFCITLMYISDDRLTFVFFW